MKFDDFKPGVTFFTKTGKWIVMDVISDSYNADGHPTPTVIALPITPNKNLEKIINNPTLPLETEFYEWDFAGCDFENRFL
jgi:hypothetical protein